MNGLLCKKTVLHKKVKKRILSHAGIILFSMLLIAVSFTFYSQSILAESLWLGDEGEEVEKIQEQLAELEFYDGPQTGFYGEQTQRGVEEFQDAAALTPDGVYDDETAEALAVAAGDIKELETLKIYDRGPRVVFLQNILYEKGYLEVEPTGLFRSLTRRAVQNFQSDRNLDADGIVGESTWVELKEYGYDIEGAGPDVFGDAFSDDTSSPRDDSSSADEQPQARETEEEESTERESAREESPEEQEEDRVERESRLPSLEGTAFRRGDRDERIEDAQRLLRQNGFYAAGIDGKYGYQTELAVKQFQKLTGLRVDGVLGPSTWEALTEESGETARYNVQRGESLWTIARRFGVSVEELMNINNLNSERIVAGETLRLSGGQAVTDEVQALDWSQVDRIFSRGRTAIITDVNTGLSFRIKRTMGTQHADVEPLTYRDTQVLRQIYGGSWSWDRRAVIVHIDNRLIAGSINGMPHGGQKIYDNGFDGHFCLHFNNSRLHKNYQQDPEHQSNISRVAGESWPVW